jgi:hypothetical protein
MSDDDLGKRIEGLESTVSGNLKQSLGTDSELFKEIDRLEKLIGDSGKSLEKEVADLKGRVKELEAKVGKMKK